jgi:1-acyl-sn-glycerol-3-phosphate acyltransferase
MLRAFSIVYWLYVSLTMPVFFLIAALIWLATSWFDRRRFANHLFSCFWASSYVYMNPLWRWRVRGRSKLPWKGPAVIVANHASLVDILVLYGLYRPFKWVSKEEMFKVPFVGWNMSLNSYVKLKRGDRQSIRQMMERCLELLRQGSPVLIFPEGTRSETGKMLPFKDGAFRLAMEAGCPVIPVAIRGTGHSVPKHGLVLRNRMDATVEVLDPIDATAFTSSDALREAVRSALALALGEQAAGVSQREGAPLASSTMQR